MEYTHQYVFSSPNTSGGGATTNFRKNGFRKNDLPQIFDVLDSQYDVEV
jgi:hypothetical protein